MHIVHVIQGLGETAGTSVFSVELANQQVKEGHNVTIFYNTVANYSADPRVRIVRGKRLAELGFRPDIVHVHSLLSLFSVRSMRWCRKCGIRYVVSPHGSLMPRVFAKSRLKKTLFFELFLRHNLNAAHAIHCTGEGERNAIRELGIRARAFIAPLGVHMPSSGNRDNQGRGGGHTLLFLSRIGEEKGLKYLLRAWRRISHRDWRLVVAGPDWRGYRHELEMQIRTENITDVSFPGLVRGEEKDRLYRGADIFVLPSPMENFSMVVLDALAYGLPVICTQGTPWRCIAEKGCGWWVRPNSVDELEQAIRAAMGLPCGAWQRMSESARVLASEFSWTNIARIVGEEYC